MSPQSNQRSPMWLAAAVTVLSILSAALLLLSGAEPGPLGDRLDSPLRRSAERSAPEEQRRSEPSEGHRERPQHMRADGGQRPAESPLLQ